MKKHILSKSTFIRGIQCRKSLYLNKHKPDLKDPIPDSLQAIFAQGTTVGELAQNLFPGGVDLTPESHYDYGPSIAKTREMINSNKVLYEACFLYDQVLCAIDILVKNNNGWHAYEVKSSTSVSDTNILDASLQYWVITNSGLNLKDISIVHINTAYTRNGEIDVKKLFTIQSILAEVKANQVFVEDKIAELKKVLKLKTIPVMDIGPHCFAPYACDFYSHCWAHIPEQSVFNISRLRMDQKFELYYKGIIEFKDIPSDYALSRGQGIQVNSSINRSKHIDREAILEFLSTLKYPLYFMDFETFNPAIPRFNNTRPYQQIPFQYSLHYKKTPDSDLTHTEFLGDGITDPGELFIKQLLKDTKGKGDVIVYNQAFEKRILNELASAYPEYAVKIESLISRIKDLMTPFQQKLYYTPDMQGSASIKSVLPAMVNLSYDDLEIGDGGSAMSAYASLSHEKDPQRVIDIRKELIEYCNLDTLAMVKILEKLMTIKKP